MELANGCQQRDTAQSKTPTPCKALGAHTTSSKYKDLTRSNLHELNVATTDPAGASLGLKSPKNQTVVPFKSWRGQRGIVHSRPRVGSPRPSCLSSFRSWRGQRGVVHSRPRVGSPQTVVSFIFQELARPAWSCPQPAPSGVSPDHRV